jgi:hypothetical protein
MNRLILNLKFLLFITIFTTNSYADFTSKITGEFNFFSGTLFDDNKDEEKKKFAFMTNAKIGINTIYELDSSSIGLYLNGQTTTQMSSLSGSYFYLSSNIGKIELGSPKAAGSKMEIKASKLAKSNSWKYFANLNPKKGSNISYITGTKVFFDKDYKYHEYSQKISYFTPKFFDKIQFGISYIPNSENINSAPKEEAALTKYTYYLEDGREATVHTGLKNAISYAVSFEQNLTDGLDLKIAFDGKYGKPSHKSKIKNKDKLIEEVTISDLNSYNIGAIISSGSFSYAISYGNANKSLTSPLIQGEICDSSWFNLAASYDQGPVGAAINYYNSDHLGNKLSALSLSTSYKITRGLKTYFETSFFDKEPKKSESDDKNNSGTILVIGMKVTI